MSPMRSRRIPFASRTVSPGSRDDEPIAFGVDAMDRKFPLARILATIALAAGIAFAAGKSAKKRGGAPRSKAEPALAGKNGRDYARIIDSLKRMESARRADSIRQADSLAAARAAWTADSVRRVDSLARIADSARVADSLAILRRTWMVAVAGGASVDAEAVERLRQRIHTELRRRGGIPIGPDPTDSVGEAALEGRARSGGFGGSLRAEIGRDSSGAWQVAAATGGRTISFVDPGRLDRASATIAARIAAIVLPSPAESACVADSIRMSGASWRLEPVEAAGPDSLVAESVRRAVDSGIRSSERAGPVVAGDSAGAMADRILSIRLDMLADSSWAMRATVRGSSRFAIDSFLVASREPAGLVARALPAILAAPAPCGRDESDSPGPAWAVRVAGEPPVRDPLERAVARAIRARTDRQFLFLPDGATDSVAALAGVRRFAEVAARGGEPGWEFRIRIRAPEGGVSDSFVLRRSGPRTRVFAWVGRRIAAYGVQDPDLARCGIDSSGRENLRWAVAGGGVASGGDSVAPLLADRFEDAFKGNAAGRLVALGDSLCRSRSCLDSVAHERKVDRILWPVARNNGSGAWTIGARVSETATDVVSDSVAMVEKGDLRTASSRAAPRIWAAMAPRRRCDTCVSTDTLEAAIAVFLPDSGSLPDSLRRAFRDTVAKVLAREGDFQVLDFGAIDALARRATDSVGRSALRCRLGAAYALRTGLTRLADGWFLDMALVEIPSGRVVAKFGYKDKDARTGRPVEMSAWAARRILGAESRMDAPAHRGDIPWKKLLKIGIPAFLGIGSVVLHW